MEEDYLTAPFSCGDLINPPYCEFDFASLLQDFKGLRATGKTKICEFLKGKVITLVLLHQIHLTH